MNPATEATSMTPSSVLVYSPRFWGGGCCRERGQRRFCVLGPSKAAIRFAYARGASGIQNGFIAVPPCKGGSIRQQTGEPLTERRLTTCVETQLLRFRSERAGTLAEIFFIELSEELSNQLGHFFWILFLLDLLRQFPPIFLRRGDLVWHYAALREFFSNLLNRRHRNLFEMCFRRSHWIYPLLVPPP